MGRIKKIRESIDTSISFVPKEVIYGFWFSVWADMFGFLSLGSMIRFLCFVIMFIIVVNYYLKMIAYAIINYADRKYPDK